MINFSEEAALEREELVAYCLAKPGAEESYPWGEAELVAKVGGKGFAFIGLEGGTVGVKCGRDAAEAAEWRDRPSPPRPRSPPLRAAGRDTPAPTRPGPPPPGPARPHPPHHPA